MIAVNPGALEQVSRKLGFRPKSTFYTIAKVVNVDRLSPATNSRPRRPPGRCDRTGLMHRPPHRRTHPRSSVVSPENPRARFGTRGSAARASHRIAAAALPDQETRADRAPVFFRSVNAGPHLRFFLEGTKIAPSHRNASVMHRTPRDRSVPFRARPLSRVALRRCDRVPACAVPPRARVGVRYEFDTIFGHTESRRTAACSPQDAQR